MSDAPPVPAELKAALIETLSHPLRARILTVIWERPGVTIKQIAERIDEPARKVRHHVERMVEADLDRRRR
jgi:DNA-binding transcriptional ArsR family regulator